MSLQDVEKQLYQTKLFNEIKDEQTKLYCSNDQRYKTCGLEYYFRTQTKYSPNIGKICQLNEDKYYAKLFEYSLNKMMPYPYHLHENYFYNPNVKSEKISPPLYYCQLIKRLLNEGLPFDRLPAFTARDVFRHLGIARNKFTEMANKFKSEKKKLLTRKPAITFEIQNPKYNNWWIIRMHTYDQDGKVIVNEKLAANCSATDIYNPQSSIVVPVSLFDCFTTHIPDSIIITRTKKFESIYYRIMLIIDDRLTVKDLLSLILPEKEHLYEQKKEQIVNSISFLVRLLRLKKVQTLTASPNVNILTSPMARHIQKKRVCFIVDESVVSTLMTGIPKTDDIKRIVVYLFEVGRLTNEQVYDLVCLIDILKTQSIATDSRPHFKKFFDVALSFVNVIKTMQQLICNHDVFGSCDGIEVIKMECLKYLTENEIENYRKKYTSAIIGSNSKIISCQHIPFCPQLVPHQILNNYLFSLFLNCNYNSGIPTMILPKGTFLQMLPKPFDSYQFISSITFSHRNDIIPTSNALLFLNETLKSQPVIVRGLSSIKPKFQKIIFPLEYSQNPLKDHPIVQMVYQDLKLSKYIGKIVLIEKVKDADIKNCDEWELYDIVFGIPMDDLEDNLQSIKALKGLLFNNNPTDNWETMNSMIQLFYEFLKHHGFEHLQLDNIISNPLNLYPIQPIFFEKRESTLL